MRKLPTTLHIVMKIFTILQATLLWFTVLAPTAHCRFTSATGNVLCMIDGHLHPMKKILVQLLDSDNFSPDDTFGVSRTQRSGRFHVAGRATDPDGDPPHPYIYIVYDYEGRYGRMEVVGLLGSTRTHSTPVRRFARRLNFGNIVIEDDHCRAYVLFYEAMKNYFFRTKKTVPYERLSVRTNAIVNGGAPYALRSEVQIPGSYRLDLKTARHELAHTVRHTLDGGLAHFLADVATYIYTRNHHCGSQTNAGFAFNEGWAEFWSNDCTAVIYGSAPADLTIEGNVANALRRLKHRCRLSYPKMVDILQQNPGNIHSYQEYHTLSGCP